MSIRLRNLRSSAPLQVPLTSGESVRVSPQQSSEELPESEVLNNPKITRLVDQGDLEIVYPDAVAARRTRSRGSAKPSESPEEKPTTT